MQPDLGYIFLNETCLDGKTQRDKELNIPLDIQKATFSLC